MYNKNVHTLIANGYHPIPIQPNSKIPSEKNWVKDEYSPPGELSGEYGIGIKCGTPNNPVIAIDLDIIDTDIIAKMSDFLDEKYGITIIRIGNAPKIMYIYMGVSRYKKRKSKKYEGAGHVEILGYGQQFIAYGIHPDTKKEYIWPGFLGDITNMPYTSLPKITEVDIDDILRYFEFIAENAGYKIKEKEHSNIYDTNLGSYDHEDPLDVAKPIGISTEELKERLEKLDPDCSRDEWRNIGMALHYETEGSDDGLDIWDSWSQKGNKYKEGETIRQWNSFDRGYTGRPITAKYLLKLTNEKKEQEETDADSKNYFENLDWSTKRFVKNPPPIPMVVDGFLPKGIVSLFYAAGGVGKSTIILNLVAKIALSNSFSINFLDHKVNPGKAVLLTAEDPDLILNHRFVKTIRSISEELFQDSDSIWDLISNDLYILSTFGKAVQLFSVKNSGVLKPTNYYKDFVTKLGTIEDLNLLVVDTKTRYSPGEGLGNVTATQEITYYEYIARKFDTSVMLLHHTNKSSRDGSQTGATAYRDASAIYDSVRTAYYLRSAKANEIPDTVLEDDRYKYLYLENSKNNYVPVIAPKIIRRDGYSYTTQEVVSTGTKSQKKEQQAQQTYDIVIQLMQQDTKVQFSQADILKVCAAEKIGRRRTVDSLVDLIEDGLLDRIEKGRSYEYWLTDEGKKYNLTIDEG